MKRETKKKVDVEKLSGDFDEFEKFVGGLISLSPEEVAEIERKAPKEPEPEPDEEPPESESQAENS